MLLDRRGAFADPIFNAVHCNCTPLVTVYTREPDHGSLIYQPGSACTHVFSFRFDAANPAAGVCVSLYSKTALEYFCSLKSLFFCLYCISDLPPAHAPVCLSAYLVSCGYLEAFR